MVADLNAVMPLITADKAKALMVALAKVPSPLTALFEAEPKLREFIDVAVEPRLREMGIAPELRLLATNPAALIAPATTREAAINAAVNRFNGDQWSFWPLGSALDARIRGILDTRFDELFLKKPDGFVPRWIEAGNEILITWQPAASAGRHSPS